MQTGHLLASPPAATLQQPPRRHQHRQVLSASASAGRGGTDDQLTPSAHSSVLVSSSDSKTGMNIHNSSSRHNPDSMAQNVAAGGQMIHNSEVKKKNRIIKFVIFEFRRPSSYFSIEISSSSPLVQHGQNQTLLVTMTEDFNELLRMWKCMLSLPTPSHLHDKISQRLVTSTKVEFDREGNISRTFFDHKAFTQKNRGEIMELITSMAIRLQAVARRFLVCQRMASSRQAAALPELQLKGSKARSLRGSVRSSRGSVLQGRRQTKTKAKKSKTPSHKSNSSRSRSPRTPGSRRRRGDDGDQQQKHFTPDGAVQRTLFIQDTPSEEAYLLQRQDELHSQYQDAQQTGGHFYEYEYPLRSPASSPSKPSSPRIKSSHSRSETVTPTSSGIRNGRSVNLALAGGSQSSNSRATSSSRPRVRTAEQQEHAQHKKNLIAGVYLPPVDTTASTSNKSNRRLLLDEIRSIKKEMSVALKSFQSEMEIVKHSINEGEGERVLESSSSLMTVNRMSEQEEEVEERQQQQNQDQHSMFVLGGGMLEASSVLHSPPFREDDDGCVQSVIKSQSSLAPESVHIPREEVIHNNDDEEDEVEKCSMAAKVYSVDDVQHIAAAIRIQEAYRQHMLQNIAKTHIKRLTKEVKRSPDGAEVREAFLLALSSGDYALASVVIRRSFEIFQDVKSIVGFSLLHDANLYLICQVIQAFVSIEDVASFGLQLLSLVSLLPNFKNCHQVMGSAGACDVVLLVLRRYVDNDPLCVQALMLGICLINSCVDNRHLMTQQKYCSIYGILLRKNRQVFEQQLVIEKTVRLLFKLTSNAPEIVSRFSSISYDLSEQIVNSLHDHLRTDLFALYCKTVVNMCSHSCNTDMKQAFGARRHSQKYIECLNVYKNDETTFKIVANMFLLICGDIADGRCFGGEDSIITEYFVSTMVSILQDPRTSLAVMEIVVLLLHRLSSSNHFVAALREAEAAQPLRALSPRCPDRTCALAVRINLLLTKLDTTKEQKKFVSPSSSAKKNEKRHSPRSGRREQSSSPSERLTDAPNLLLPKTRVLQEILDVVETVELLRYLALSIHEGRDSVALQTIIRITTLIADKQNNNLLAVHLLDDMSPVMEVLRAFSACSEVQLVGINLVQLLKIEYSGQITTEDSAQFLKILTLVIWGHFSSASICEKYLDFMLLHTAGDPQDVSCAGARMASATVETFAAVKNIMCCHTGNAEILLKCCQFTSQLAVTKTVRTMIHASSFNESFVDFMQSCDFDERTATVFGDTILTLCAGGKSTDHALFFSHNEAASLYLHLLHTCQPSGRIWSHVLKVLLFLAKNKDERLHRGLHQCNFAGVLSRALHSYVPHSEASELLIETITVFIMGLLSSSPALERRFVNVDTANFVAAINSKQIKKSNIISRTTLDACKIIAKLLQTVPIAVAVKRLSSFYVDEHRKVLVHENNSATILQKNIKRLAHYRSCKQEIQHLLQKLSDSKGCKDSIEPDFIFTCLEKAMAKGSCTLVEASLEKINELLDDYMESHSRMNEQLLGSAGSTGGGAQDMWSKVVVVEEVEDSEMSSDLLLLTRLASAPAIILMTMLKFLSVAPVQSLSLRVLLLLPYNTTTKATKATKEREPLVDVFFLCLLRHINNSVLCGEVLDCLIFLTDNNCNSEANLYSASNTPVSFRVLADMLKAHFENLFIMNKLCQLVTNMCSNLNNHMIFSQYKVPQYVFQYLSRNVSVNDVVCCCSTSITALCTDTPPLNLETLARSPQLKLYYSILRRNPRNMAVHIHIGKMLLGFSSGGGKKESRMRVEYSKSRVAEELQSLLRNALQAINHQGVAACLVALTVHFICYHPPLRKEFVEAGVSMTLLEYLNPEWSVVVRSMAYAGLSTLGETRHKTKFLLARVFDKNFSSMEMNFSRNMIRIQNELSLQTSERSSAISKVKKEKTLQREQQLVDNFSSKKQPGEGPPFNFEAGSWFDLAPSEDEAAITITRAAKSYLARKAAAASLSEEQRRLPVLKQLSEGSSDTAILWECLEHCAKWGRLDLGLVVTRRLLVMKPESGLQGLFKKLSREPGVLIDILKTFNNMLVLQRQVLTLLQLLPFDQPPATDLLADSGTCEAIFAVALRHSSNVHLCLECIKTLIHFAAISPRIRSLLCEAGRVKTLLHLLKKHQKREDGEDFSVACFVLVANVCKDSTDNQTTIAGTNLSLQVMKFMEKEQHAEEAHYVSVVCSAVRALCEGGDLSNMEQYFTRKYLVLYHHLLALHSSNKMVVRKVYSLLMMAARCTGPFTLYFATELEQSDAASFLVRAMTPEEENRQAPAVFFLLLILACTYLRAAPALIPELLKANMVSILRKYKDASVWNQEVQKSATYCLRILRSWSKAHDPQYQREQGGGGGEGSIDDSLVGSLEGGSSFVLGSIAFDDSVSVLTHDVNEFGNQHSQQQQVDEGHVSDLELEEDQDEEVIKVTEEEEEGLNMQPSSLQESFTLLQHAVDGGGKAGEVLLMLLQTIALLQATDMSNYMEQQGRHRQGQENGVLVCDVFPGTLHATMLAFPQDKQVQLAGFKALETFPCDLISPAVNFGKLMSEALKNGIDDTKHCMKMMKYCLHFTTESENFKRQISSSESLVIVLSLMRQNTTELDLMKLCFRLIFLLCRGTGEAQTLLSKGGVGSILLALLTSHRTNREIVSLVGKVIVALCMNKNHANISDFGSLKNMQIYLSIIKDNAQDAHICSSMSFVLLGVLSLSMTRDGKLLGALPDLQQSPFVFAQALKQMLESDFSPDAAEVIIMMVAKVVSNVSALMTGFIHVRIAAALTEYSASSSCWTETTRLLAAKTLRILQENGWGNEDEEQLQVQLQLQLQQQLQKQEQQQILEQREQEKRLQQEQAENQRRQEEEKQLQRQWLEEQERLQQQEQHHKMGADEVPRAVETLLRVESSMSQLTLEEPCEEKVEEVHAVKKVTYAPSSLQQPLSPEEAQKRIAKFFTDYRLMTQRQRSRTSSRGRAKTSYLQEVDVHSEKVPVNELLVQVVKKGRIHLAVSMVKKILMAVQGSNDKNSGMASELAADPKPLMTLMFSFLSVESVPRDGLLILRALVYSEEGMGAMGELGVCNLMYAIIQRYEKSNLHVCVSALKTLTFFAKGSVHNRRAMTEKQSLGLLRVVQKHEGALFFMLEACATFQELTRDCPENKTILASSPLSEIAMGLLLKFGQDKECICTVGGMIKVICKESNEQMLKNFASRECLAVLFQILKENIENEDISKLYCSTLTLLLGADLDYYLAEFTASGASSVLSDILANESTYRHRPSLLTPIFSLLVHYVYHIPLLTLDLYRTDIPVALELFGTLPAWSDSKKAADIILSKIKTDLKQVEVNRKKALRLAEKQKKQRMLHRQTSIPNSGIDDWTDLSDLFLLLQESFEIKNSEDILLICKQISQACRMKSSLEDRSVLEDKALLVLCREHVPLLLRVLSAFPADKALALVGLQVLAALNTLCHTERASLPDLQFGVGIGSVFVDVLQVHEADGDMCLRLLEAFLPLIEDSKLVRRQLATEEAIGMFLKLMKRHSKRDVDMLTLGVSYVSALCRDDDRNDLFAGSSSVQTRLCEAGLSKLILSLLIDSMDEEQPVSLYVQLMLVLSGVSDGSEGVANTANLRVFASPSSLKLFLHISKSSPASAAISSAMCSLVTTLLSALVASLDEETNERGTVHELVRNLQKSSFILELCTVLTDQKKQKSMFEKAVVENNLVLTSFIVNEVKFLRQAVISADVLSLLRGYVDGGDSVGLSSGVMTGVLECINKLSS